MNKYLNFVKSIYNIEPIFDSYHVLDNRTLYKAKVEYAGVLFESTLDSITETKHFDSDYYSEDIAIALIIKLNNEIFDYLQANRIE